MEREPTKNVPLPPRKEGGGTYRAPRFGWVCFHCGERFLSEGVAREHFGPTPASVTACSFPGKAEVIKELRRTEGLLDSLSARWGEKEK